MKNNNCEPLVSIITVVYNGEKHLEQTIKSIINQTYKNIEYIIIDGGSQDNTINIIKQYEQHISFWISEPDNGLYDAMNKGIKYASGELIGILNSDDWYEKDAVETIVNNYLKNKEKRIFHVDRYDVYETGERKIRKFNPSKFKFKYYGMTYNHPGMFISKKEYDEHFYNNNLKSLADYQFVLEAFLKDENKFHYIEKPIVNFRLGGISSEISLLKSLHEGFIARKNAGMNIIENIFSVCLRLSVFSFYKLKKLKVK